MFGTFDGISHSFKIFGEVYIKNGALSLVHAQKSTSCTWSSPSHPKHPRDLKNPRSYPTTEKQKEREIMARVLPMTSFPVTSGDVMSCD